MANRPKHRCAGESCAPRRSSTTRSSTSRSRRSVDAAFPPTTRRGCWPFMPTSTSNASMSTCCRRCALANRSRCRRTTRLTCGSPAIFAHLSQPSTGVSPPQRNRIFRSWAKRIDAMSDKPLYSLEFFPPRTPEGVEKLRTARREFAALKPAFCSVTFGAGGSTREGTLATVLEIRSEGMDGAPHVSCIGSTRDGIREVLAKYREHGIRHLVALRGDLPSGSPDVGDFRYANELVRFIREETGDWFHIDVAAYPEVHPQARNPEDDLASFQRKIDAGADSAITQYFFNTDAYWHFVDECGRRGVDVPIVPGIMPIGSFSKLARFSDACGAEIPRWIRRRLEALGDDSASIRAFGLDVVTTMCASLIERGAPGLHFYTLNQPALTTTIWRALRLGT